MMTNKKTDILRGSIGDLYSNDRWVRAFMDECLLLWGLPCSSLGCMSQKDRTMFAWGMLHMTHAMKSRRDVWKGMRAKVEPKEAAWEFTRRFYEETNGESLIPCMPDSDPGTLSLTGPMKTDGHDRPVTKVASGSV